MVIPALALVLLAADDYHVSPVGDDARAGTSPETAWRTLARVGTATLRPGDRVLLEGGKVHAGTLELDAADAGTVEKPVTIGSYGEGRAVVRAGKSCGLLARNCGGIAVENLEFEGTSLDDKLDVAGVRFRNDLQDDVKLGPVRVSNVAVRGFRIAGVHLVGAKGTSGYRGVLLEKVQASGNGIAGVLTAGPGESRGPTIHEDVRVVDGRFHDNEGFPGHRNHSGNGILVGRARRVLIERCSAWNNGRRCDFKGGGPVGIWVWDCDQAVIQGCESYANRTGDASIDGGGFDFDGIVTRSVMQHNVSRGNDGAGFLVCPYSSDCRSEGNVIRYNLSVDDGRAHGYSGIHVYAGGPVRDVEVYHNTILVSAAAGTPPRGIYVSDPKQVRGLRFRNNVLVAAKGVNAVEVGGEATVESVLFQGNAYWAGGAPLAIQWGAHRVDSLDAWRGLGQETLEGKPVGLWADPRLEPDRRPGRGSPLVNAGLDLRKLFGLDPGAEGRDDIGAFEFEDARGWVEKLRSDKIEERDEAARRLRSMGKAAVPELEKAAKDADAEVAARAMGLLRVVNVIGALTPRIRKAMPEIEQRLVDEVSAAEIFLALSVEKDFPLLRREDFAPLAAMAIAGARKEKKQSVCAALAALDVHEAVPGILKSAEEGSGGWALEALALLHARETAPRIAARLVDPDQRHDALRALVDLEAKEALPEILKLLDDPKSRLEAAAAAVDLAGRAVLPEIRKRPELSQVLENLAPDEAAAGYMELIRKDRGSSQIFLGLARVGAIRELRTLLGDPKHRSLAVYAIGLYELKGAEAELRALLKLEDEDLRADARKALGEGSPSGPELMKLLEDEETAPDAIQALAELGWRDAIPAITKGVASPNKEIRAAAMRAVGLLGARDAAAAVAERLAHEEEATLAAWALGRLGAKEQLPAVLKALRDGFVDDDAAEALLKLGAEPAEIGKLLTVDDYGTRTCAVRFLALTGEAAIPRLLGVLDDGWVRTYAAPFLCAAGRREAVPFALENLEIPDELNAVRSPEAWKALAGTRLERKLEGRYQDIAAEVARRLGLALEWSPRALHPKVGYISSPFDWIPGEKQPITLLSQLRSTFHNDSTFILEPGRLRVLPRGRALVLWREWWDAEEMRAK